MHLFLDWAPLIREHSIIFILITSLFFGEEIILILSFLSANGYLPIWLVFVFCFIGRVASDFFFFAIGKLKLTNILTKYQEGIIYKSVDHVFSKLNRKSLFVTLLYTKFLFGIRAAMMIYLGHKKICLRKALLSDIAAVFVWLIILIPIGWFAGNSFKMVLSAFNNLKMVFFFLFFFVLILVLINNYIKRIIQNKKSQL